MTVHLNENALLNWNDIEIVLLDMDGTLLDLHFDNHFWLEYLPLKYAELHALDIDGAKTILFEKFERERGSLNWYCLDFWSNQLKMDIAELKKEVSHLIDIRPNVVPFLSWLNHLGKPCYLVTNAHQKSLSLKLEKTGIDQHVDEIFCAHDFNAPKESQDFWQRFQRHLRFKCPSTLLIDDSEAVLKSAQQFGIGHLLSIQQPDSQSPQRAEGEFPALSCYSDLMKP